jgi:2'-5' RNA ligase
VFPKPKKPRVLYLGVDDGKTRMKSFVSHLNKELKKCKFSKPLHVEVCTLVDFYS